ncbi:MAG: metallophosphoesterase [Firmicutes bacterium]|nr:metallophosphoesterase [Bacillota bacterium]
MAKKIRSKEEIKKARRKRWLIVLLVIVAVIGLLHIADRVCCNLLVKYVKGFDAVDYSGTSRSLPVYNEEEGHYSFSSKDGLKIMMLTDIHLGGGRWTYKTDRKAIYEIITMLQNVKPDLVVLCGDNIFACPGPIYNGGGNLDNKLVSKVILELFEHEGVYFTTVFGNHDTEVFDLCGRQKLAELYESEKYTYCIFEQEFTDEDAEIPSVTNQIISVKNAEGGTNKLLLFMDTNAYVDKSIKAVLDWNYDVIHQAQVDWAKEEIRALSDREGYPGRTCIDTVAFMHIPVGEYQEAYKELELNGFRDTENTEYIEGVWDEKVDDTLGIRIWFGGCSRFTDAPVEADTFFETLGPEGVGALEAVFCGHDHTNNVAVRYMGVTLAYGMSMDNTAYDDIALSGLQRGCTVIEIDEDGTMTWEYKNAYKDLGVDANKFADVYLDHYYYDDYAPKF